MRKNNPESNMKTHRFQRCMIQNRKIVFSAGREGQSKLRSGGDDKAGRSGR